MNLQILRSSAQRYWKQLSLFLIVYAVTAISFSFAENQIGNPEAPDVSVNTSGKVFPATGWIHEHLELEGLDPVPMWTTLGEYDGSPELNGFKGKIVMEPIVPGNVIELYLGGSLLDRFVSLTLHDLDSDEVLELRTKLRIDGVSLYRWSIPKDWCNRNTALVAIDENPRQDAWIGLSKPLHSVPTHVHYEHALDLLRIILNLITPLTLYLAFGITAYSLLARLWKGASEYMVILVLTLPLAIGYLQFYVALESLFAAHLIGIACLVFSAVFLMMGGVRHQDFPRRQLHYYLPVFLLVLFAVVMVTSILYMGWSSRNPVILAQERFLPERLPLDNYLPLLTLNRIYDQDSLKPFIIEWRSTDRPPLQTAACLLVRPFFLDPIEGYQIFSTWLHASILISIAFLLKSLGVARRNMLIICSLILFSGTFLINTLFVWPKLFAVSFPFFATGLLLRNKDFEHHFAFWLILGSISAFALLIHPGSLFALLAILVIYTLRHRKICWQQFAAAAVVLLIWMLPWLLYQKHYDPPGDFMQKRFFANYPYFDDVRFPEALKIGYGELTLQSWASGRWENIKTVIGNFSRAFAVFPEQILSESLHLRIYIFNFIGVSLIPLILGYPLSWLSRRKMPNQLKESIRFLHAGILFGMAAWIILILPPGRTIITHGSFYFPVLIMVIAGLLVQHRPKLLLLLLTVQYLFFQVVWATPAMRSYLRENVLYDLDFIDWGSVLCYLLSVACIFLMILRKEDPESGTSIPTQTETD